MKAETIAARMHMSVIGMVASLCWHDDATRTIGFDLDQNRQADDDPTFGPVIALGQGGRAVLPFFAAVTQRVRARP